MEQEPKEINQNKDIQISTEALYGHVAMIAEIKYTRLIKSMKPQG
jgi:hypothetical protein